MNLYEMSDDDDFRNSLSLHYDGEDVIPLLCLAVALTVSSSIPPRTTNPP